MSRTTHTYTTVDSTTSTFYTLPASRVYLASRCVFRLFAHAGSRAIGYLGLQHVPVTSLAHACLDTSSDRQLTHSTLPRPVALRAVRTPPPPFRPDPVEANQRSNCNSKIILSLSSRTVLSRSHGTLPRACCGRGCCTDFESRYISRASVAD